MSCTYFIDHQRRLVITTGSGRVTVAEIKSHREQLVADPDFHPDFDQLIDMTEVSALDLSMDEAKSAGRHPHFSSKSRRAWVATTPDIFAMGRLMAAHDELARGPAHVGVFYERAAALQWLGLDAMPESIRTGEAKRAEGASTSMRGSIT